MRTRFHAITMFTTLFLSALFAHTIQAKDSQLEFVSTVVEITPSVENDNEGVVTILVKGFEVPIMVNMDTKIEEGDEIGLAGLFSGDSVKIEAFFADDGNIFAEEIKILERMGEHFRFKGEITNVQFDADPASPEAMGVTIMTVLGVDVLVEVDTPITRSGSGRGNRVSPLELTVGDIVDVRGNFDGVSLWADRIHVGNKPLGQIEIDGEIMGATPEGFTINISRDGSATVVIDADTSIRGQLTEGAFVRVEGMLNEELAILASEISVRGSKQGGNGNSEEEGDDGQQEGDADQPVEP